MRAQKSPQFFTVKILRRPPLHCSTFPPPIQHAGTAEIAAVFYRAEFAPPATVTLAAIISLRAEPPPVAHWAPAILFSAPLLSWSNARSDAITRANVSRPPCCPALISLALVFRYLKPAGSLRVTHSAEPGPRLVIFSKNGRAPVHRGDRPEADRQAQGE